MGASKKYTAIITRGLDGWFVGKLQEAPGVLTQGKTVEETKANLAGALKLYLQTDENGSE
jgi:predicted RNase H-like HicB family nuclease